ncbi:hypothetical protein HY734_03650 [Candidatus Uhrbacteria bacterium]|nr:hypothetical protein [Candidatus Uhrbacteria bacterium]
MEEPQIGAFTFSPDDASLLAFVSVVGPDNEHGAVYVLDLKTGAFKTVATNPSWVLHMKGWSEDSSGVYYE